MWRFHDTHVFVFNPDSAIGWNCFVGRENARTAENVKGDGKKSENTFRCAASWNVHAARVRGVLRPYRIKNTAEAVL
jgi:hypothetical protein